VLEQWYFIVEAYAERNLTFETDQLPALAGIAKIVGRLIGYSYKAGLWEEDLLRDLLWNLKSGHDGWAEYPNHYVAPSWS
jgi:hypothetical protein